MSRPGRGALTAPPGLVAVHRVARHRGQVARLPLPQPRSEDPACRGDLLGRLPGQLARSIGVVAHHPHLRLVEAAGDPFQLVERGHEASPK